MITQVLTTGDLDYETPQTGSSTSDFNQDSYDRYLSMVRANLHGRLNAAADNVSLETDPLPHSALAVAGIGASKWIVHLGNFGLVSPVQSRSVLTDYSVREAAAYIQDFAEHVEQVERAFETRQKHLCRIKQLRDYAAEDGIQVNRDSEKDFWSFVDSAPFANRAGLVLMDNGNLRAVWKGDDSARIGIQFLGRQIDSVLRNIQTSSGIRGYLQGGGRRHAEWG